MKDELTSPGAAAGYDKRYGSFFGSPLLTHSHRWGNV
jgi:hypothetical protein